MSFRESTHAGEAFEGVVSTLDVFSNSSVQWHFGLLTLQNLHAHHKKAFSCGRYLLLDLSLLIN